jgi:hypothetical protein
MIATKSHLVGRSAHTVQPLGTHASGRKPANPFSDAAPMRPRLARVLGKALGVALAVLLVLPAVEATQPAEAGKKFKTITKTASSSGQIAIPDSGTKGPANPYPSTITVDDFEKFKNAKIKDVDLTLRNFSHSRPENVDVMLVHGNRHALVMADAGNATDANNITITLDDQASQDLPDGAALTGGTFRPADLPGVELLPAPAPALNGVVALSTFNGADPDGEWQIFVGDDANLDTGSLAGGWKLEITAKVKDDKSDKTEHSKKHGKHNKDKDEDKDKDKN